MTVLDLGYGPGFFSIEMAKMVGSYWEVAVFKYLYGNLEDLTESTQTTQTRKLEFRY
jgi:ubiquinone/menaquinone biosynthesis C-methylase UbiE